MKLLIIFTVLMASLLTIDARKSNGKQRGEKNSEGNATTMECLGQHLPVAKLTFGMTECTEEIAINPQDQVDKPRGKKKAMKKNHMCIKLCQRKKQGILDSNGKLSETGSNRFIEDLFPQKARPRIQRGFNRCAEDHGDGFSVANNCKEYKRFEKCMTRIITKACGLKNDGRVNGGGRGGKNAGRRNGNKGKNKGNNRRQQSEDHVEDDEDSEVEE